jgi:hypothetical protein
MGSINTREKRIQGLSRVQISNSRAADVSPRIDWYPEIEKEFPIGVDIGAKNRLEICISSKFPTSSRGKLPSMAKASAVIDCGYSPRRPTDWLEEPGCSSPHFMEAWLHRKISPEAA